MKARSKIIQFMAITICMFIATAVTLQAEENKTNSTSMDGMTDSMQKSMSPEVWNSMMAMMMNPEKMMSMESCVQCHDGEDVARYQKDFGPMMEMMKPMAQMMSPHMMNSMMNPMMGMINPMMGMMNPAMYMNMMNPMMGMMNPMMGMMNPSMMMNPMMGMNMMYPMMGMMGPMMNPMGGMGMMPGMGGAHGSNPMGQMPGGQMMDPKQYEQWFSQWTEMMNNMTPQTQQTK